MALTGVVLFMSSSSSVLHSGRWVFLKRQGTGLSVFCCARGLLVKQVIGTSAGAVAVRCVPNLIVIE